MNFLHSVALFFIFIFGLYFVIATIVVLISFFKNIWSHPQNFFRTLKRKILFPTYYFTDTLCGKELGLPRCIANVVYLLLIVLISIEGYRYAGFNTTIGSYTEYPNAQTCMFVQVHRIDANDSKYYNLPAAISRTQDNIHTISYAFWPNGGYLAFSQSEPTEVSVGKSTYGVDQDGNEWDIILTNNPASHPNVSVTSPHFNSIVLASIVSCFFLLVGLFPFKYPIFRYADDYTKEELPFDLNNRAYAIFQKRAQHAHMDFVEYMTTVFGELDAREQENEKQGRIFACMSSGLTPFEAAAARYARLENMSIEQWIDSQQK